MSAKLLTVACRLPHGLVIEVGKFGSENYRQMKLNGPFSKNANGDRAITINGYAFTKVPEDVWNEFYRTHKTAAYLMNRAVYAEDADEKAKEASANVGGKTGFEALNPDDKVKLPDGTVIEADADHLQRVRRGEM